MINDQSKKMKWKIHTLTCEERNVHHFLLYYSLYDALYIPNYQKDVNRFKSIALIPNASLNLSYKVNYTIAPLFNLFLHKHRINEWSNRQLRFCYTHNDQEAWKLFIYFRIRQLFGINNVVSVSSYVFCSYLRKWVDENV